MDYQWYLFKEWCDRNPVRLPLIIGLAIGWGGLAFWFPRFLIVSLAGLGFLVAIVGVLFILYTFSEESE